MESIWTKTVNRPRFESLQEDAETDVLIIGGGMAGILCAEALRAAGIECMLLEADKLCAGTTANTTAKITYQHGLIYDKVLRKYGAERAALYFDAQRAAMEELKRLCKTIKCDFIECDNFVYSIRDRKKLERELRALECLGADAFYSEKTPLPIETVGAVGVRAQAAFHPLKLLFALSKNLNVFENSKVTEFLDGGVRVGRYRVQAKKIIVATHFPIFNKHGAYFLKMYQHRSYVLALENTPLLNGMYVDEQKKGLSFRGYNGLLLLGGGSHRTGKQGGSFNELSAFAKEHYADAKIVCRWATQDCMTLDGIPYIGRYKSGTADVYVTTGFNKWGMTSSMLGAMLLTDLIAERKNPYMEVLSPQRRMLHPQLFVNVAESLVHLLKPTAPRCPHLGCALQYNREEHSWDCACHGSRFKENGELLNGPATDDLKNI